jgi:ADP-ribose pyrophosphatase YjhB (NUDIX family)
VTGARERRERVGARVLIIDAAGHVLLVREPVADGTHWLAPGGGVEAGEQLAEAAARELYEETGIRAEFAPDALPVHVAQRWWPSRLAGVDYHQTDHYYVLSVATRPAIEPAALTPAELEWEMEYRWWSIEALRANVDETIEPPDLADLIARLHRSIRAGLGLDGAGRVT